MADANTSYSDIIATTIQSRSKELADNLTNSNALLYYLNKRGNVKPVSGGNVILQEIKYPNTATNGAAMYSGYDTLSTGVHSPISAASFDLKLASAPVVISGEELLKNSGKEQMIDLLDARMEIAEDELFNLLGGSANGIYSDGTGTGGKALTGLQSAVADDPTTGTYGGIDRSTWSFWRNYAYDATTDGGAAATAANIQGYMNTVALNTCQGREGADLIVADNNYYGFYLNSLQAIQRVTSEQAAGAGFASLKYFGSGRDADVVLDGGIGGGCPTNHMYFLNTKFLFLRPHKDRNMVALGKRMATNQDAEVQHIGWAGNLTCSSPRYQGVLKD